MQKSKYENSQQQQKKNPDTIFIVTSHLLCSLSCSLKAKVKKLIVPSIWNNLLLLLSQIGVDLEYTPDGTQVYHKGPYTLTRCGQFILSNPLIGMFAGPRRKSENLQEPHTV